MSTEREGEDGNGRTLLSWSPHLLCVNSWHSTLLTSRYGLNPSYASVRSRSLIACPAFTFNPSKCGSSCGASSVSSPTENSCLFMTCRMAGSEERRSRVARAEAGLGRC